ncbi:hypothetical protein P775_21030 [Puniceibacterium antarcticum]|uniref:RadC-like JAB domain-containing protein n=1 Tax=Puniceibacterium antarcticum TaxID=1206336 RepID=A0A2G8R9H0_9RHOB|nr:hypothetical protein P775_21030 [Puniceibacterium antarcticum]
MTEKLRFACEAIDVTIHDHVIIGEDPETSFRGQGLL